MRLSTYNNFAYHMGNTVEDWMLEIQKDNLSNKNDFTTVSNKTSSKTDEFKNETIRYKIKKKIVKRIFKFLYPNK